MGNKPGAIVLGMDPPGLCSTDLSSLPLTRQPWAHRTLRGQESTAPAASFCSCCHHNVITFPDRLAASPQILYSITLLLESQKYLHPLLPVFPNFCLNLPQEHSGLFWFFFPDNLLISPILASLPAAITIRGQWYRSGSAKNRCQQESRKLQNRRMVFYKGDDSTRKGWGTCTDRTGCECKPLSQSYSQVLTLSPTQHSASHRANYHSKSWLSVTEPPPPAWCHQAPFLLLQPDTSSTFQTDVANTHYRSEGRFWPHTAQAHHRPVLKWDARAKLLI